MRRIAWTTALILCLGGLVSAAPSPVRLGYLNNDLHHLSLWVGLERGFFKEEGLDVSIEGVFNAGPEEMMAFASRSLDIGYLGVAPSLTGVANKSASVKAIALANTEGSAIVVRKESPIKDVKALSGKTVAIPGYSSVQDILLKKALEQAGLDHKKVTVIVVKPPEMLAALDTKQIDAFIAWEPHPARAVKRGIGRILATSGQVWRNHPCCVVAVEETFHARNADRIKAFLRAHVRAVAFISGNPAEAVRIAMKYTGMDEETIREAMRNITYHYAIPKDTIREYAGALLSYGYIKQVSVEALLDTFLDTKTLLEVQP